MSKQEDNNQQEEIFKLANRISNAGLEALRKEVHRVTMPTNVAEGVLVMAWVALIIRHSIDLRMRDTMPTISTAYWKAVWDSDAEIRQIVKFMHDSEKTSKKPTLDKTMNMEKTMDWLGSLTVDGKEGT